MQDGCRTDEGVACEWQLLKQIEDTSTYCVIMVSRRKENCFEVAHFLGDPQHLLGAQI